MQKNNALSGIKQAILVLSSNKSGQFNQAISLRILSHLVGDIHQPLHTATKVSKLLPKGDLGGNLFYLESSPLGNNLHQYWDNGAGILMQQNNNTSEVKDRALQLQKKCSCNELLFNDSQDAGQWIKESHKLATTTAYMLSSHKIPNKKYRIKVQKITEKQLLFAGCRLAALINELSFGHKA